MVSIKKTNSSFEWAPLAIVIFTAAFRVALLAIKPPHFDEGVNGWFLDQMAHDGYYAYDPSNYHGPFHFYLLFLFKALFGRSLWALRMPIVIVSTLTVWLVTRFDRFMDRRACWFAAMAMAVSPGAEFYGRYAIHESEMVFFLILMLWGALGLRRYWTIQYLWAAALGATGMILTKETYIIHFTAFALAWVCFRLMEKVLPYTSEPPKPPEPPEAAVPEVTQISGMDILCVGAVSLGLIVFFYSGTFLDFPALKGLYLTFGEWARTAKEGHGHEKPPDYWLRLALRYEWPVIIGMVASLFYIWPKNNRLIRYLLIYGWGALVAYSIIHYKTPWCIITIVWPFFFIFGQLFADLMDMVRPRAVAAVASAVLAASFVDSTWLSFYHYTDEDEPYVYVQTLTDINKLTDPVFKLVAEDKTNYQMSGHIILDSYHPLPWVLGDFPNIGYYDDKDKPDDMDADFLLVGDSRVEEIEKGLKQEYFVEKLKLRSSMDPAKLFLNTRKFQHLWPGRKPDFVQGKAVPADDDDEEP